MMIVVKCSGGTVGTEEKTGSEVVVRGSLVDGVWWQVGIDKSQQEQARKEDLDPLGESTG